MKPFACPQITTDFEQLISNGSEMNEQGNMTHALHRHYCRESAMNLQSFPWEVREIWKQWGKSGL